MMFQTKVFTFSGTTFQISVSGRNATDDVQTVIASDAVLDTFDQTFLAHNENSFG